MNWKCFCAKGPSSKQQKKEDRDTKPIEDSENASPNQNKEVVNDSAVDLAQDFQRKYPTNVDSPQSPASHIYDVTKKQQGGLANSNISQMMVIDMPSLPATIDNNQSLYGNVFHPRPSSQLPTNRVLDQEYSSEHSNSSPGLSRHIENTIVSNNQSSVIHNPPITPTAIVEVNINLQPESELSSQSISKKDRKGDSEQDVELEKSFEKLRGLEKELLEALKDTEVIAHENDIAVTEKIGEGASSVVYKGYYKGICVGIKQLIKRINTSSTSLTDYHYRKKEYVDLQSRVLFLHEAMIMSKLRHPQILLLLGVCPLAKSNPMMITEYCEGGTLFSILHQEKSASLPWSFIYRAAISTAKAIEYLHMRKPQVVHRDIKSLNVLLTKPIRHSDFSTDFKLSDFGLSQKDGTMYPSEAVEGTLLWLAPETLFKMSTSVNSGEDVQKLCNSFDPRASDVYSFSMLLYELIARTIPFYTESGECTYTDDELVSKVLMGVRPSLKAVSSSCPPPLVELMTQCWDPVPSKRPSFTHISTVLNSLYNPNSFVDSIAHNSKTSSSLLLMNNINQFRNAGYDPRNHPNMLFFHPQQQQQLHAVQFQMQMQQQLLQQQYPPFPHHALFGNAVTSPTSISPLSPPSQHPPNSNPNAFPALFPNGNQFLPVMHPLVAPNGNNLFLPSMEGDERRGERGEKGASLTSSERTYTGHSIGKVNSPAPHAELPSTNFSGGERASHNASKGKDLDMMTVTDDTMQMYAQEYAKGSAIPPHMKLFQR